MDLFGQLRTNFTLMQDHPHDGESESNPAMEVLSRVDLIAIIANNCDKDILGPMSFTAKPILESCNDHCGKTIGLERWNNVTDKIPGNLTLGIRRQHLGKINKWYNFATQCANHGDIAVMLFVFRCELAAEHAVDFFELHWEDVRKDLMKNKRWSTVIFFLCNPQCWLPDVEKEKFFSKEMPFEMEFYALLIFRALGNAIESEQRYQVTDICKEFPWIILPDDGPHPLNDQEKEFYRLRGIAISGGANDIVEFLQGQRKYMEL